MSELTAKKLFAIGEVVQIVCPRSCHHGKQATIIGYREEGMRKSRCGNPDRTGFRYLVDVQGQGPLGIYGGQLSYFHDELKRIPPPREDLQLVRWDECPWQPETINV